MTASNLIVIIGIDQLIPQCAHTQIRFLRNVKQRMFRSIQSPIPKWPQFTQNTKQRRFTTSIGTNDHQILSRIDGKFNFVHQQVTIWSDNGNLHQSAMIRQEGQVTNI